MNYQGCWLLVEFLSSQFIDKDNSKGVTDSTIHRKLRCCVRDDSQQFFDIDYIIIATILARCLDDFLESQSKGQVP